MPERDIVAGATFVGAVTTTGRSEALRLEKSFFRANPEFRQRARVRAHVIGRGQVLLSLDDLDVATPSEDEPDPVAAAYLAFIERDMLRHPDRLAPLEPEALGDLADLLRDVEVGADEELPDGVGF